MISRDEQDWREAVVEDFKLLVKYINRLGMCVFILLFYCSLLTLIVACTSTPKPTLTDCTRSKLNLNVQLNGVGPEEIEKINQVTAECLEEGR